jgi:hypothetical protein
MLIPVVPDVLLRCCSCWGVVPVVVLVLHVACWVVVVTDQLVLGSLNRRWK